MAARQRSEVQRARSGAESYIREVAGKSPADQIADAKRLLEAKLPLPGYEMILKAAHTFNLLDARGAISVTERAAYIGRIRNLARGVAQSYFESRERLGFPLAPREWVEQMTTTKKAA